VRRPPPAAGPGRSRRQRPRWRGSGGGPPCRARPGRSARPRPIGRRRPSPRSMQGEGTSGTWGLRKGL